jgi:hypothetical protein
LGAFSGKNLNTESSRCLGFYLSSTYTLLLIQEALKNAITGQRKANKNDGAYIEALKNVTALLFLLARIALGSHKNINQP